jgi:hypothetical protein
LFLNERFELVKFTVPEAVASFKADRIKPELGLAIVSLHMHVRRLVPIGRIEEEPIWSVS